MTIPDSTPPSNGGKKAYYSDPKRKPVPPTVNVASIPAALKALACWVLWLFVWKGKADGTGKWDKVPKTTTGRGASHSDPKTWTTFDAALAAYHRGGFDGLGFAFPVGGGWVGLDLDDVRNPHTGELAAWADTLIGEANTYTEVSPSGTGVKLFGRGTWAGHTAEGPGPKHRRPHPSGVGEIEVYSQERYFAVTGWTLPGTPTEVNDLQPLLDALTGLFTTAGKTTSPPPTGGCPLADDELLDRIRWSKHGAKFSRLWAGDTADYGGDESRADLALCGILAFWCHGDRERMERLFSQSALGQREKWHDRPDYRKRTIGKALSGQTEFYQPTGHATFTAPTGPSGSPTPPRREWPAPVAPEAFSGLFGRIVRTLEPHTEADPVALLVQLLILFGNVVGRGPHFIVEATKHYTNEFAVLVGNTSRARKGTSKDRVTTLYSGLDDDWLAGRVSGGLSSAEGLIHAVRDPLGDDDPGEADKRLCAVEGEWSSVLKQADRTGNTLTELMRNLWDGLDVIGNKTVNPRTTTGAHVSVIAHTTAPDLIRYLTGTDAANGYGNRHLLFCVRRSQFLPWGGCTPEAELNQLRTELHRVAGFAQHTGEVGIAPAARPLWEAVYPVLEAERGGLAGAMTARGSAHVRRLALLFALADCSTSVRPVHLLAALALWDYAERSVGHLFGDKTGNPLADEIQLLLTNSPAGLTRDEIVRALRNHHFGDRLTNALAELQAAGQARVQRVPTGGRPAERWHACHIEPETSSLMTMAREAVERCEESDESEETPPTTQTDTPFRRFRRFDRTPEPVFGKKSGSEDAPPERPRVPDVVEVWLAHQLWWGPKSKDDIEKKAKAAGMGSLTRYVKLLHIQPRELAGGVWEWELPAGLNRDLYPTPPTPPPPPPEPTLFDGEADPPAGEKSRKGQAKKRKPTRRESGT